MLGRETELIDKLDGMTQSKLKGLAAQRDHPNPTEQLSLLHERKSQDRQQGRYVADEDLHRTSCDTSPDTWESNTEANIVFSCSAEMCQLLSEITGTRAGCSV